MKRFPKSLTPRPKAGLLIVALSTNTPVYAAGLRTGDVIVQLDHEPIGYIKDFHRKIDALEPGASLSLTAWRDGQLLEPNVTIGRETFRYNGSVAIGIFLNLSDGFNLWPTHEDPRFSLLVLGCDFSSGKRRAEIDSVRNAYERKCNAKNVVEPVDGDYR
ncbi:MAG TPA: PDZ domain-containing protein, partial [Verrucomicrobiae bacterium]|nr:PDZ domain-containing protein [Verrucomicrobiae bacterium]